MGGHLVGAGVAVTKIPVPGNDGAVGIRGAGTIELYRLIGRPGIGVIGVRNGCLVAQPDGGSCHIRILGTKLVCHRQGNVIGAVRSIGVGGRRAGGGVAVTEIPFIGNDGAVGIRGT